MSPDELRAFCLGLAGAVEERPFGPLTSVFKVGGKMFLLSQLDSGPPLQLSLKIDPPLGEDLRASYECVRPGYHLNKKHWVTIEVGGDVPDTLIEGLIEDSYDLVKPRVRSRARAGARARGESSS